MKPDMEQLESATQAFLEKWAPVDRIEEFGNDLRAVMQAACDVLEAAAKKAA